MEVAKPIGHEAWLEQRRRSIGAGEIGAIVELERRREPVDIWALKYRGPALEVEPLVREAPPPPDKPIAVALRVDTEPRQLGKLFEHALAEAYEHRTGNKTRPWQSREVHPSHAWATCTPDGGVQESCVSFTADDDDDGGLELKMVGHWMRSHWPSDGVPPYVVTQCQWSMWITGKPWWDVCALVDGTDLRIHRIERDDEIIDGLAELGSVFWHDYVLANKMPPASGEAAMRVLLESWRQDNGETLEVGNDSDVEAVVRELVVLKEERRSVKKRIDELNAYLCARTGAFKTLGGPWGKFHWGTKRGTPSWKNIALELAEGNVPNDLIEKHRGNSRREPRLYAHKEWKKRLMKKAGE